MLRSYIFYLLFMSFSFIAIADNKVYFKNNTDYRIALTVKELKDFKSSNEFTYKIILDKKQQMKDPISVTLLPKTIAEESIKSIMAESPNSVYEIKASYVDGRSAGFYPIEIKQIIDFIIGCKGNQAIISLNSNEISTFGLGKLLGDYTKYGFKLVGECLEAKKEETSIIRLILDKNKSEEAKIDELKQALSNKIDINKPSLWPPRVTPLSVAAGAGYIKIVEFLLDNGAKINEAEHDSLNTALMYAAEAGQYKVVNLLLNRGANVNQRNKIESNALLFMISRYGQARKEADDKAKFDKNIYDITELFIHRGIDINAHSIKKQAGLGYQRNAIIWAASYGRFDIVKLLHSKGADLCVQDENGQTLFSLLPDAEKMPVGAERTFIEALKDEITKKCKIIIPF